MLYPVWYAVRRIELLRWREFSSDVVIVLYMLSRWNISLPLLSSVAARPASSWCDAMRWLIWGKYITRWKSKYIFEIKDGKVYLSPNYLMKRIREHSLTWCSIWFRQSILDWDILKRTDKMWIENLRKTNGTKENEMLTGNGNEKMGKTRTKSTQKGNYMVHWFHYQYDDDVPFFYFIFPFAIMSSYDWFLLALLVCVSSATHPY